MHLKIVVQYFINKVSAIDISCRTVTHVFVGYHINIQKKLTMVSMEAGKSRCVKKSSFEVCSRRVKPKILLAQRKL